MTQINDESAADGDEPGGIQTPTDTGSVGAADAAIDPEGAVQAQLEAALAQAEENHLNYLRALADLDNFRKRTQRELENAHKYGLERLAGELLLVRDSLEAGMAAADQGAGETVALVEGAQATLKLLDAALAKFAIEVIDPHGEPFDPNYHEAMTTVDAPDAEPNTVVTVVQKGFRIHERLLRPARVLVSKSADG